MNSGSFDHRGEVHTVDGWEVREHGPRDASHSALCLPGALCSEEFFADVLAQPSLAEAGVRLVTTTLPGYGGSTPTADHGIEGYAAGATSLAEKLACDAVVGHSVGANVAIEMAGSGAFLEPLVLLSPSFSRPDEAVFLRVMDRVARLLGKLPYAAMLKVIGPAMKGEIPEARFETLVGEMQKNDPAFVRSQLRLYFEYLERHGSVAPRLCDSGVRALVVYGEDKGEVGITDEEQSLLEACATTTVEMIPGASHMTLLQQPARIAALIAETISG
jgi:pimeloyl-ACP methyl ester carboxylesterase